MLKSTDGLGISGQKRRGKVVSPFGRSAPDLLTIPTLAASIPATVSFDHQASRWAKVALLWLEAGELSEDDSGRPVDLVEKAVTRWMTKQVAGIKHLGQFDIVLHAYPSPDGELQSYSEHSIEHQEEHWFFGVVQGDPLQWYELENRITALDQAHPGLGQTAYHLFQDKVWRLLPIFTPEQAFQVGVRTQWYGMETQEDFIEEMQSLGCEDEDICDGPGDFVAGFPEWMFGENKKVTLSTGELETIVASSENEEARSVARLLLELQPIDPFSYRLPWVGGSESPIEEDNAYFLAYVRWNRDDQMSRMDDDFIEYANQCGDCFTDFFGADAVSLDAVEFQKWKSEIEAGFAVLRKLDALFALIAGPFNQEER